MAKETTKTEQPAQEAEKTYNPMEDMIAVTLPRATGNEQNFIIVALNGKVWKIMKGVTVQVPRPVYDILSESIAQENRLYAFNEAQASKANPG